jgi:hypothetical protein
MPAFSNPAHDARLSIRQLIHFYINRRLALTLSFFEIARSSRVTG